MFEDHFGEEDQGTENVERIEDVVIETALFAKNKDGVEDDDRHNEAVIHEEIFDFFTQRTQGIAPMDRIMCLLHPHKKLIYIYTLDWGKKWERKACVLSVLLNFLI